MAAAEIEELDEKLEQLTQSIRLLLLPKDEADEKSIILEIRGGTGGDEAALFAGDLFRMYERCARAARLEGHADGREPRRNGGYKEVIANVSGKGVLCADEIRVRCAPRAACAGDGRRRGASTLRRRRLQCCPRSKTLILISKMKISASIRCALRVPAGSTSTPPTRRCASPICQPGSLLPSGAEIPAPEPGAGHGGAAGAALRNAARGAG